jgi:hypothetical protein
MQKMSNSHEIEMHSVKSNDRKSKGHDIPSLCVFCEIAWSIMLWSQTKCTPIIEDNVCHYGKEQGLT